MFKVLVQVPHGDELSFEVRKSSNAVLVLGGNYWIR